MPPSGEEKKGKTRPRGFHLLAERARACFGVIQGEKFVYVNSHFARRTGFDRRELLAADLAGLIPPLHRPSILENIRQGLAAHEESVSFELPLVKKNGEELWLDFSATRIDYLGKPALIGVACDISARKRAEEELRERESRYRILFSSLQETFAIDELVYGEGGTPVDWVILDVNPAYEQTFGIEREKVVGQRASVVYGAEIVDTYLPLFAQVVASGRSLRFEYHRGELVSLVSVFPLGNRRLGTLGLDISEHRRVQREREQLLAQVESRAAENDAIINAIVDALIIYGPDGEIVRMNPVAEKIFHYTPAERSRSLAARVADLALETMAGQPLPLEETPFWRALHGETISGFVLRFRPNHRQSLWVSVSAAPVRTGAERMGAVLTFTDITPLRELQEQRQIYLSTISHDLRTPLTIIHGHAQLLDTQAGKGEIAETSRASIDAILQGSRLMETMIDALVDSAYLESGQMSLKQEPVLLDIFVRDLLQRTRSFLEREQITAEIPPDLPPVFADPVRLERILLNLLANAVKYSAAATPITVTGWPIEKNRVAVSVQDHGRGINAEDLPHIFERFYRTREGRKGKGIGLGLYIARLLVEAHGGTIRVASTPGAGSTFVFTLPLVPADQDLA